MKADGEKSLPKQIKDYEEWLATADPSVIQAVRKAFGDDLRPFYKKFREHYANYLKNQENK